MLVVGLSLALSSAAPLLSLRLFSGLALSCFLATPTPRSVDPRSGTIMSLLRAMLVPMHEAPLKCQLQGYGDKGFGVFLRWFALSWFQTLAAPAWCRGRRGGGQVCA